MDRLPVLQHVTFGGEVERLVPPGFWVYPKTGLVAPVCLSACPIVKLQ